MSQSAYVEFSELKEVGVGTSKMILMGAAVVSEGLSVSDTISQTSISAVAAEAVGVVRITNLSEDTIKFAVAASAPTNFNAVSRVLKTGQDITLNCIAGSKVFVKKVM